MHGNYGDLYWLIFWCVFMVCATAVCISGIKWLGG
jgi:hypothetical protein